MAPQLVICGMHRSGTSLVASAMQQSGVDIGRRLIGAGRGNLQGHFEDQDFHDLHEALLAAAGQGCFTAERDLSPPPGSLHERRARELAADRAGRELWGWKDPRTCLFLQLWERLLPAASYLFVYRHPIDVALSLLRRDGDPVPREEPWAAIRSWVVYNRCLLAFRDRHPQRCFLAHVPTLAQDLPVFVGRVAAELDLPLRAGAGASLFIAAELSAAPRNDTVDWESLVPEALELYRRLDAAADLPSAEAGSPLIAVAPACDARSRREHELLQASENLLHAVLRSRKALAEERQRTSELAGQAAALEATARELGSSLATERAAAIETSTLLVAERAAAAEISAQLATERAAAAQAAARLADARAELAQLETVLKEIESSRAFALVSWWWRARGWWRRRVAPRRKSAAP